MRKLIDKKAFQIIYTGKIGELKSMLECLVEKIEKNFLSYIEPLSQEIKILSSSREKIYYNNKKLIYVSNASYKKALFSYMIEKSKEADLEFIAKNPNYEISNLKKIRR